jgi:hypothetical protein
MRRISAEGEKTEAPFGMAARAASRSRRVHQTPVHLQRGLRRRCSCSSPPAHARFSAARRKS